MRRSVIAFLTLALVFSLTACTNNRDTTGSMKDGGASQKEYPMTEGERSDAATQDPDLGDRARRSMDRTDDAIRRGADDVGDAVRRGVDDVGDVVRDGKNAVKDALTDDRNGMY